MLKFKVNHTYYNSENGWKLKFGERDFEGYYIFKVLEHDDPENDWMEYSTKDGSEIVKTKKEVAYVYSRGSSETK